MTAKFEVGKTYAHYFSQYIAIQAREGNQVRIQGLHPATAFDNITCRIRTDDDGTEYVEPVSGYIVRADQEVD